MNQASLKKILSDHCLWVNDEGGERANLSCANLSGANLSCANLSGANLSDANLSNANLLGANLRGANGNMIHIKSMQLGTYSIAYTSDYLQIGCERHPIKAWWGFDAKTIEEMDCNATEFWCKFKSHIKQTIELSPAEATGYKESEK